MYQEEYFYQLTDELHHNVYASLLKDKMVKEENTIIKIFKKENNIVVIETNNFKDTILKDTRTTDDDLMTYDLIYLKSLNRYISDYELPNMSYEYIEGLGAWTKVKIDGYNPNNKLLKPFFLKKKITKEDLKKYSTTKEELDELEKFYDLTKGLLKFSKPKEVKEFFEKIEK